MSKATPNDVIDLGFDDSQFNKPDDWKEIIPAGYLQRILDSISLEVAAEVGSAVYAAAIEDGSDSEKLTFKRLKKAERYFAAEELWIRIESFERSGASKSRGDSGTETIGSRALRTASEMLDKAEAELSLITGKSYAGGIAVGTVESGQFEAVS